MVQGTYGIWNQIQDSCMHSIQNNPLSPLTLPSLIILQKDRESGDEAKIDWVGTYLHTGELGLILAFYMISEPCKE